VSTSSTAGDGEARTARRRTAAHRAFISAQHFDVTLVDGDIPRLGARARPSQFYARTPDLRPTTVRPPVLLPHHEARAPFDRSFGRHEAVRERLSALMNAASSSPPPVVLFVIGPLIFAGRGQERPRRLAVLAVVLRRARPGFMLIEVSVLQNFVAAAGHVYSLRSRFLRCCWAPGWERRGPAIRRSAASAPAARSGTPDLRVRRAGVLVVAPRSINWAIPFSRSARSALRLAMLVPSGSPWHPDAAGFAS